MKVEVAPLKTEEFPKPERARSAVMKKACSRGAWTFTAARKACASSRVKGLIFGLIRLSLQNLPILFRAGLLSNRPSSTAALRSEDNVRMMFLTVFPARVSTGGVGSVLPVRFLVRGFASSGWVDQTHTRGC
jgi:hypothetical protein